MKHVNKLNLNENNDPFNEEKEEITVKVKDVIKYLQDNFEPDANVYLDHDGWWIHGKPKNVQDLIEQRGLFYNFRGDLIIQN